MFVELLKEGGRLRVGEGDEVKIGGVEEVWVFAV